MKKRFQKFRNSIMLFTLFNLVLIGCTNHFEEPDLSCVSVRIDSVFCRGTNECVIELVPDAEVASFKCAVGKDSDLESFVNSEFTDQSHYKEIIGNNKTQITFTDLESGYYSVFAQAYDKNGTVGGVSVKRIFITEDNFRVEPYYITDNTAGFKMVFTPSYYRFEYYLGTEKDKDDFIAGNLDIKYLSDISIYRVLNFENLEPGNDYVLYMRAYDLKDNPSALVEVPFKTFSSKADYPSVDFEIEEMDVYRTKLRVIPDDDCELVQMMISMSGTNDDLINSDSHFRGDIPLMINNWVGDPSVYTSAGEVITIEKITPEICCDVNYEIYACVYTVGGELKSMQHFQYSTPSPKENVESGKVEITIEDIGRKGATYRYTFDEKLFGFFYETVDADWYDDFKLNSEEWNENYLHDLLYSSWENNSHFIYAKGKKEGEYVYVEVSAEPAKRYYAVACPVNENGASGGWMPVEFKEYVTEQ